MGMYHSIRDIYHELFPLNSQFTAFIKSYIKVEASLLDIGCGDGRYVHELSKHYEVTGIDADQGMIEQAKKSYKEAFYNYSFDQIELLEVRYDGVYCIGNAISYLPTDRIGPFLKSLNSILHSNAVVIFQTVNWDRYALKGKMDFPVKSAGKDIFFKRRYRTGINGTVLFSTELTRGGKVIDSWEHTLYPKKSDEFAERLSDNSFKVKNIFGDYNKSEHDALNSPATIWVAHQ